MEDTAATGNEAASSAHKAARDGPTTGYAAPPLYSGASHARQRQHEANLSLNGSATAAAAGGGHSPSPIPWVSTPMRAYISTNGNSPGDEYYLTNGGLFPPSTAGGGQRVEHYLSQGAHTSTVSVEQYTIPPPLVYPHPAQEPATSAAASSPPVGLTVSASASVMHAASQRRCYICDADVCLQGTSAERRGQWDAHVNSARHQHLLQQRAMAAQNGSLSGHRTIVHGAQQGATTPEKPQKRNATKAIASARGSARVRSRDARPQSHPSRHHRHRHRHHRHHHRNSSRDSCTTSRTSSSGSSAYNSSSSQNSRTASWTRNAPRALHSGTQEELFAGSSRGTDAYPTSGHRQPTASTGAAQHPHRTDVPLSQTTPHRTSAVAAQGRPHEISVLSITNEPLTVGAGPGVSVLSSSPFTQAPYQPSALDNSGQAVVPVETSTGAALPAEELTRLLQQDAERRRHRREEKEAAAMQTRADLALMRRCVHRWYNAMFVRAIARGPEVAAHSEPAGSLAAPTDGELLPQRETKRGTRRRRRPRQDGSADQRDTCDERKARPSHPPAVVTEAAAVVEPARLEGEGDQGAQDHWHRREGQRLWLSTCQKTYAAVRLTEDGVVVPVQTKSTEDGNNERELEVEDVAVRWYLPSERKAGRGGVSSGDVSLSWSPPVTSGPRQDVAGAPHHGTTAQPQRKQHGRRAGTHGASTHTVTDSEGNSSRFTSVETFSSSTSDVSSGEADSGVPVRGQRRQLVRGRHPGRKEAVLPHQSHDNAHTGNVKPTADSQRQQQQQQQSPSPSREQSLNHLLEDAGTPNRRPRRRRPDSARRTQTSFELVESHHLGSPKAASRDGTGPTSAPHTVAVPTQPSTNERDPEIPMDASTTALLPGGTDARSGHTSSTDGDHSDADAYRAGHRGDNDAHSPFNEEEMQDASDSDEGAGAGDTIPGTRQARVNRRRSSPTGYHTPFMGSQRPAGFAPSALLSVDAEEGSIRFAEEGAEDPADVARTARPHSRVRDAPFGEESDGDEDEHHYSEVFEDGSSEETPHSSSSSSKRSSESEGDYDSKSEHQPQPQRVRRPPPDRKSDSNHDQAEDSMSTLVDENSHSHSNRSSLARTEGHTARERGIRSYGKPHKHVSAPPPEERISRPLSRPSSRSSRSHLVSPGRSAIRSPADNGGADAPRAAPPPPSLPTRPQERHKRHRADEAVIPKGLSSQNRGHHPSATATGTPPRGASSWSSDSDIQAMVARLSPGRQGRVRGILEATPSVAAAAPPHRSPRRGAEGRHDERSTIFEPSAKLAAFPQTAKVLERLQPVRPHTRPPEDLPGAPLTADAEGGERVPAGETPAACTPLVPPIASQWPFSSAWRNTAADPDANAPLARGVPVVQQLPDGSQRMVLVDPSQIGLSAWAEPGMIHSFAAPPLVAHEDQGSPASEARAAASLRPSNALSDAPVATDDRRSSAEVVPAGLRGASLAGWHRRQLEAADPMGYFRSLKEVPRLLHSEAGPVAASRTASAARTAGRSGWRATETDEGDERISGAPAEEPGVLDLRQPAAAFFDRDEVFTALQQAQRPLPDETATTNPLPQEPAAALGATPDGAFAGNTSGGARVSSCSGGMRSHGRRSTDTPSSRSRSRSRRHSTRRHGSRGRRHRHHHSKEGSGAPSRSHSFSQSHKSNQRRHRRHHSHTDPSEGAAQHAERKSDPASDPNRRNSHPQAREASAPNLTVSGLASERGHPPGAADERRTSHTSQSQPLRGSTASSPDGARMALVDRTDGSGHGGSPPQDIPSTARGVRQADGGVYAPLSLSTPVHADAAKAALSSPHTRHSLTEGGPLPADKSLTTPANSSLSRLSGLRSGGGGGLVDVLPARDASGDDRSVGARGHPRESLSTPADSPSLTASQLPVHGVPGGVYVCRDGKYCRVPDLSAAALHSFHGEPIYVVATPTPAAANAAAAAGVTGEKDKGQGSGVSTSQRSVRTPLVPDDGKHGTPRGVTAREEGREGSLRTPVSLSSAGDALGQDHLQPRTPPRLSSAAGSQPARSPRQHTAPNPGDRGLSDQTPMSDGHLASPYTRESAAQPPPLQPSSRPRTPSGLPPRPGTRGSTPTHSWPSPGRAPSPAFTRGHSPMGCGRLNPYCSVCRAKFNLIFVEGDSMRPVRWPSPRAAGLEQLGECRYREGYLFGGPTAQPLVPVHVSAGTAAGSRGSRPTSSSQTSTPRPVAASGTFVPVRFRRVPAAASPTQYSYNHPHQAMDDSGEHRHRGPGGDVYASTHSSLQHREQAPPRVAGVPSPQPTQSSQSTRHHREARCDQEDHEARRRRKEERRLRKRVKQLLWRDVPEQRDSEEWHAFLRSLSEGLDLFEALAEKQLR